MGEPAWLVVAFTADEARRKVRHHVRTGEWLEDGWTNIRLAAEALWYANQTAMARHGREFKVFGVDAQGDEVREMAPEPPCSESPGQPKE